MNHRPSPEWYVDGSACQATGFGEKFTTKSTYSNAFMDFMIITHGLMSYFEFDINQVGMYYLFEINT